MLTSFQGEDPSQVFSPSGEDRVDAWAPDVLKTMALEAGFVLSEIPTDPSLLGEAKDLADRIALAWKEQERNEGMKAALFAALREETFGCGEGEEGGLFSLALLRHLATLMGVPRFPALDLLPSEKIPRRIPRYEFRGEALCLGWSKGGGLSWEWPGLRPCRDLFSLEVQGDRGGLSGFLPGIPERPRRFLAAHMHPFSVSRGKGQMSLGLKREFRLPEDPEEPKGRLRKVDWELRLWGDLSEGWVEAWVCLRGLPPGQRVRLLVPVPFFPRPTKWESPEGPRAEAGPCPGSGFQGPLHLETRGYELQIEGPGWREMEIYPCKNEHMVALTLFRAPSDWQAPYRVVRKLRIQGHRAKGRPKR